jgi:hypothetical protein
MNCSVAGCGWDWSSCCCDCSIDGASYALEVGSEELEVESDAGVSVESPPGFVMLFNLAYALVLVVGVAVGHQDRRRIVELAWR